MNLKSTTPPKIESITRSANNNTWDEWNNMYKPVQNRTLANTTTLFGTQGKELEFIQKTLPNNIWTLVDGTDENTDMKILPGIHTENIVGYFVTEKPWTDNSLEFVK